MSCVGLIVNDGKDLALANKETLIAAGPVVLPELVASHWWEHLLHNHTALRLKAALCKTLDGPAGIVIEDIAPPKAGPGQAVIAVQAAAPRARPLASRSRPMLASRSRSAPMTCCAFWSGLGRSG